MKIVIVGLFFFITSAVFANDERELYVRVANSFPEVGVVTERYLGDRLMMGASGEWRECITPTNTLIGGSWGYVTEYRGGIPICKKRPGDKHYIPDYANRTKGETAFTMSVQLKTEKNGLKLCLVANGISADCVKNLTEDDVLQSEKFVVDKNIMQQSLEYSGKRGNVLTFIYAEFKDGMAREAFTREFTVDLAEGNIAAYKGAIIEVINATNVQIEYKIIRHFPS